MSFEYTYGAHPTVYNGRQYRSRLEARWAAFFDRLEWLFEYEPMDLGTWSPDFLIRGKEWPILVEVKPIDRFHKPTADKMAKAANAAHFGGELLLLGINPFVVEEHESYGGAWLGWLDDGPHSFYTKCFRALKFGDFQQCCCVVKTADGRLDFCHIENHWAGRITGDWDGQNLLIRKQREPQIHWSRIKMLWADAINAVQWQCNRS